MNLKEMKDKSDAEFLKERDKYLMRMHIANYDNYKPKFILGDFFIVLAIIIISVLAYFAA